MKTIKSVFLFSALACIFISCEKNTDHLLNEKAFNEASVQSSPNMTLPGIGEQTYTSEQIYCSPITVPLCIGSDNSIGTVTVKSGFDGMTYITYKTIGDWFLQELNLYAGTQSGLPVTNSGKPLPVLFPHTKKFSNSNTQEFTFTIPNLPSSFIVSAHAFVVTSSNSEPVTAWGDGCGAGLVSYQPE